MLAMALISGFCRHGTNLDAWYVWLWRSRGRWHSLTARSRYRALVPEIAFRVYTRDGLSDKVWLLTPGQRGECAGVTLPCQKPRDACTREMTFPTSVGWRGPPLSEIASRVYTRDGLSDNVGLLTPLQRGGCAGVTPPCQKPRGACTREMAFLVRRRPPSLL